jgi:hypothetical protein
VSIDLWLVLKGFMGVGRVASCLAFQNFLRYGTIYEAPVR